ncbi:MAG: Fe-S oxidoreductase, partial [Bacteroidota bacterium]
MISSIIFIMTLGIAGFFIRKRVIRIQKNIQLGKVDKLDGPINERWKNMLLVAFGQKKMFKRLTPAFFHFLIYAGFLIINLEVLEFVIDGIAGTHRIFAPFLGGFYNVLMNVFEFLAVAVLVSCIVFLVRRNVLKIDRFQSAEMTRWPRLDANLILTIEIILMMAILTMNASDQLLQTRDSHYVATGPLFFSGFLTSALQSLNTSTLVFVERFCWWFHIVGILAFTVYITYSKHLHIFFAFINTYRAKLEPKGHINNMPVVTKEVKTMLGLPVEANTTTGEPGRFGAKDINDLTQTQLMAAYSCTECG